MKTIKWLGDGLRKFNALVRFFCELKHPKEKCARLGHAEHTQPGRIRRNSKESCYVVMDYSADIVKCGRCGETLRIENEQEITGYTGCQMPSSMWNDMRTNGFCIVE